MAIGMPTAVPIAVLEVLGAFVELDVDDELVADEVLDMDEGDAEVLEESTVLPLADPDVRDEGPVDEGKTVLLVGALVDGIVTSVDR